MDGQQITLWTVRLALAFYVLTLAALLARARPGTARGLWTLGCLCYLAHVAAAFHFFHGWSHAAAYRDTARQTYDALGLDWGGGIWFNYVFTVLWAADATYWWEAGRRRYRQRPRCVTGAIHAFMAFMWVNAAIVFPTGPVRWVSLAAAVLLLIWWASTRRRRVRA
jgi:hypothetical protein